ncbi:terminase, partial [Liberibacter sp. Z1]|nr:terminase [Candidatus Liberibacter sp.]
IPSIIFKTAEGFFTEDIVNRMWLVFSNPRRRTGPFFEIFDKDSPGWIKRHISGFDVEGIDHQVYHNWIRQYGEDSNIARHDVYGQFPLQDTDQFFSASSVKQAEEREPYYDEEEPLIMGLDVAGGGKDSTVAVFRRGLDAQSIPLQAMREKDQNRIISWATSLIHKYNPDAIVVDGNGIGNGVFYGLQRLRFNVHEYVGQRKPNDEEHYANKRAENYYLLHQWLNHGSLEKDDGLRKDLLSIQQDISSMKVQLVSKEKSRAKGIPSPDRSDALALTFHLSLPRVNKSRIRISKARFAKTMSLGD